jgi:hypothetical protein
MTRGHFISYTRLGCHSPNYMQITVMEIVRRAWHTETVHIFVRTAACNTTCLLSSSILVVHVCLPCHSIHTRILDTCFTMHRSSFPSTYFSVLAMLQYFDVLVVQYMVKKKMGISRYLHTPPTPDILHNSIFQVPRTMSCISRAQNSPELPFSDQKSYDLCKELKVVERDQDHKRATPASTFEAHSKAIQRGHDDTRVGGRLIEKEI